KNVDNRRWPTTFRGPFFIHAAKTMTEGEYLDVWNFVRDFGITLPLPNELQFGGIIGKAKVLDCVRVHSSRWFFGPWAFLLSDAEPLPFTPCAGKLGFFDLPSNLTEQHRMKASLK